MKKAIRANPLAHLDYIKYVGNNPGVTAHEVANHFGRDPREMRRNLMRYATKDLLRMETVKIGILGKFKYEFHANMDNEDVQNIMKEN